MNRVPMQYASLGRLALDICLSICVRELTLVWFALLNQ